MPDIHFDSYYCYDDLTRLLHDYATEFPDLVQVESIGQSYEGRDIWLATVTNSAAGPAGEKPALWIDGNIHASEVSPSSACLYFIDWLTTGYGQDAAISQVLDSRAFYICPRVNPDGAEWALADKPKIIRSSTRPYPYDEEPIDGLAQEDMDGDGRMLTIRVPDPNGSWKVSPDEPRLLVQNSGWLPTYVTKKAVQRKNDVFPQSATRSALWRACKRREFLGSRCVAPRSGQRRSNLALHTTRLLRRQPPRNLAPHRQAGVTMPTQNKHTPWLKQPCNSLESCHANSSRRNSHLSLHRRRRQHPSLGAAAGRDGRRHRPPRRDPAQYYRVL